MTQEIIDIDVKIKLNKENVMSMLDCSSDNPVYDEVSQCYEQRLEWLYHHVKPRVLLSYEPVNDDLKEYLNPGEGCTGFLYAVLTIGGAPQEESRRCFGQGEYLDGMLVDAMADAYLFALENAAMPRIRKFCAGNRTGIFRRMEAPQDFPLEFHKHIYEMCQLEQTMDMKLSSGCMFDPVKTSCIVFVQSADPDLFNAQHDCSRCSVKDCPLRSI